MVRGRGQVGREGEGTRVTRATCDRKCTNKEEKRLRRRLASCSPPCCGLDPVCGSIACCTSPFSPPAPPREASAQRCWSDVPLISPVLQLLREKRGCGEEEGARRYVLYAVPSLCVASAPSTPTPLRVRCAQTHSHAPAPLLHGGSVQCYRRGRGASVPNALRSVCFISLTFV